jgi:hypothetical protein
MLARFLLILGGLFVVGVVGAFLFYVSLLTIMTLMAVLIGLIGTLVLGYCAGSQGQHPPSAKRLRDVSVINAPEEVSFLQEVPFANTKLQARMGLVPRRSQAQADTR